MVVVEIQAKSILRKHKKIDSWFLSRYGMNLYRGCFHNCSYCDGRSESYYVRGEFGEDVEVKVNAIEILNRELSPKRKRVPIKPAYVMLGGGVGDSYQPIEKQYQLTRKTLQLLRAYRRPVHVLTKSTLVERDLDIIKKINQQNKAIVSFSFSTTDDKLASIYEPGVPPPTKRLHTLKIFKEQGIATGMFLLPVIPFITDSQKQITAAIRHAKSVGVDFVIFGVMTLKRRKQADYFLQKLKQENPEIIDKINAIYRNDKWGSPSRQYYNKINDIFSLAATKYQIPRRIPPLLYNDILSENDLVIVTLEHIDYLQRLEGKKSSFGYVAYQISKIKEPLSIIKNQLSKIKGINKKIIEIILEVLEIRKSYFLEELLYN